jgi:sulfide:quinone oxidoreductase
MPTQPVAPLKPASKRRISDSRLHVVIAGGGVAALEAALALRHLAADQTDVTVIAPNLEFVYRPMTIREPFAYRKTRRYALARIVAHGGAELLADELAWVDPGRRVVHTGDGEAVKYDALLLALGARARPRYKLALTIDDRCLDQTLDGLIEDVEGGYIDSLAFVIPWRTPLASRKVFSRSRTGRTRPPSHMAWPLPVYELALMTAGRANEVNVRLKVSVITPEDAPLAVLGTAASTAVVELLERTGVHTITSAHAEVPRPGEVLINPGDRCVHAERVIALPQLHGPSVRGIPADEDGFIAVNSYGLVDGAGPIFAAGDATDFAVKHGGVAAQQADAAASTIAALAGARVTPEPFHPVIRGQLLTDSKPLYLTSRIVNTRIMGGQGSSSEITDTPTWSPGAEITAKYLAPYLAVHDHEAGHRETQNGEVDSSRHDELLAQIEDRHREDERQRALFAAGLRRQALGRE